MAIILEDGTVVKVPELTPEQKASLDEIDKAELKRSPGTDPKTGEYSTAQMLWDEIYGGDTSQPLFD